MNGDDSCQNNKIGERKKDSIVFILSLIVVNWRISFNIQVVRFGFKWQIDVLKFLGLGVL